MVAECHDAASGTTELKRAPATLAGKPGSRLDWRDDDVGTRGFDVIVYNLAGAKPIFKFSC